MLVACARPGSPPKTYLSSTRTATLARTPAVIPGNRIPLNLLDCSAAGEPCFDERGAQSASLAQRHSQRDEETNQRTHLHDADGHQPPHRTEARDFILAGVSGRIG